MDPDRLRRYRENLDFYGGQQWVGTPRRRERHLTFNYAKAFVDKATSYLMAGMTFAVEPVEASAEAEARARRAEEALRRIQEEDHLEQLDFDTELDAAILGDGAYKVTWDPEEQRVRISAPDVQGLYAWWVGDDVSRVWRIASRYQLSSEEAAALYGVRPPVPGQRAKETAVTEVWTQDRFELWVDQGLHREGPNPYGVVPFVVFPNLREPKRFWGVSDIPPLMEPARELNRAISQLSMILELSGNPIAVLEGVEEARDIAVQPGAVWELPERARAYLLDLLQGGGIKLHVDFIEVIYRALHDLSEAPRTSFGDNPRSLSGVALEMEMHPLLQRVRRKRLIRTAAYRRRNELALRILEQHTGERYLPVRQRIVWGPLLPQDRGRLAEEERVLVEAGIHSRRRAMANLGVEDPEAEWKQWLEEEGRATSHQ
ncbi:MAG: phage portal protein [Chloroflexi bacterium]|nr:phage portal protein [Chloroflexota bacterium]